MFICFWISLLNVRVAFHSGTTPLHWAAHRGFVAIAGMLLDKRADVDSEDNGFGHPLKLCFCDTCTLNHAR
jgi:ankyrin repeat protein